MRLAVKRAAAALLAVAAAHPGLWFWATGTAAAALQQWATDQRARGWQVSFTPAGRAGWPMAALARVTDLRMSPAQGQADLTVDAAAIGLGVLDPGAATLQLQGAVRLHIGDLPEIRLTADRLAARVPLTAGQPPHAADLVAEQLRIGSDSAVWLTVAAADLQIVLAPSAAGGQSVTARLRAGPATITPPADPAAAATAAALGTQVQRIDIATALTLPPQRQDAPAAVAWRDAGGTLQLTLAALDWGHISASGEARLALDAAMQPTGQARLHLAGFNEALQALASGHVIPPRTATAAGAILSLLARPQPDGSLAVDAPLTLQDSMLQLGRIPLLRVPKLQWQGTP